MPSAIHVSSQTVYYETTHIQQKATDKTLSIAYCTQICTRKETISEKRNKIPIMYCCISRWNLNVLYYAILCTMFHRIWLYRADFLFRWKFICYI